MPVTLEKVLEAAPEDREYYPEALQLKGVLELDIWPVTMFGQEATREKVVATAVQAGYNPSTGAHRASMEAGGAVIVHVKGTRCVLYWD